MFFFDEATFNPGRTKSNEFFYPHPTDSYKHYQCDESGISYLHSFGELVWDELRMIFNWLSAVPLPSSKSI